MPKILIKSEMRRLPKCCAECTRYINSVSMSCRSDQQIIEPACSATSSGIWGWTLKRVKVTKERPDWCPLVEISHSLSCHDCGGPGEVVHNLSKYTPESCKDPRLMFKSNERIILCRACHEKRARDKTAEDGT